MGHRPGRGELAGRRVPDLHRGERQADLVRWLGLRFALAARDQDPSISEESGDVTAAGFRERARGENPPDSDESSAARVSAG